MGVTPTVSKVFFTFQVGSTIALPGTRLRMRTGTVIMDMATTGTGLPTEATGMATAITPMRSGGRWSRCFSS